MSEDKIKSEATDWLKTVDESLVAFRRGGYSQTEASLAQAISALLAACREIKADLQAQKLAR